MPRWIDCVSFWNDNNHTLPRYCCFLSALLDVDIFLLTHPVSVHVTVAFVFPSLEWIFSCNSIAQQNRPISTQSTIVNRRPNIPHINSLYPVATTPAAPNENLSPPGRGRVALRNPEGYQGVGHSHFQLLGFPCLYSCFCSSR